MTAGEPGTRRFMAEIVRLYKTPRAQMTKDDAEMFDLFLHDHPDPYGAIDAWELDHPSDDDV